MVKFSELTNDHQSLAIKMLLKDATYNDFNIEKINGVNLGSNADIKLEEILNWYNHQTTAMLDDKIEYFDKNMVNFISKTFYEDIRELPIPNGCNFKELVIIDYIKNKFTTFIEFVEPILPKFTEKQKLVYVEKAELLSENKKVFSDNLTAITENLIMARLRTSYSGMLKEAYTRDIMLFHPEFDHKNYIVWEPSSTGDKQLKVDFIVQNVIEDCWVFLGITGSEKGGKYYPVNCDVIIESGAHYKNKSFHIVNGVYLPTTKNISDAITEIINFNEIS